MAKRQSEGRILTTHVGVLEIPADVEAALAQDAAPPVLTEAVAAVVRRQVETGLDIVNDGEFGKSFCMRPIDWTGSSGGRRPT